MTTWMEVETTMLSEINYVINKKCAYVWVHVCVCSLFFRQTELQICDTSIVQSNEGVAQPASHLGYHPNKKYFGLDNY
jgi:hypothetical protein